MPQSTVEAGRAPAPSAITTWLRTIVAVAASALALALIPFAVDAIAVMRATDDTRASAVLLVLLAFHTVFAGTLGTLTGGLLALLGGRGDDVLAKARATVAPIRALRARRSAEVLLWPLAGMATFLALALLARRFFGFNNPRLAAYVLSASSLVVVGVATLSTVRAIGAFERLLRRFAGRWPGVVDEPAVWALLPVGLVLGGGAGIVLKNSTALVETLGALPLGPLVTAPLLMLGAATLEVVARRSARTGWVFGAAGGMVIAAPLSLSLGLGSFGSVENGWVHEHSPLGSFLVGVAERLTDRDKDGFSALFGHGDCDDHDARAFPGSDEGDDCLPDAPLEDKAAFEARLHGTDEPDDDSFDAAEPTAHPAAVPAEPGSSGANSPVSPSPVSPGPVSPSPVSPSPVSPSPVSPSPVSPSPVSPSPVGSMAAAHTPAPPTSAPPVVASKGPHLHRPYNVVLITADTIRADHTSLLGYGRDTTENLDRLGKNSLVFERAYAPANMTPISMGALLSGRFTSELYRDDSHFIRFDDKNTFLAERLTAANVLTSAVVVHWYFEKKKKSGLDQGFQRWQVVGTKWGKEMEDATTSDVVADAAIAELGRLPTDRPWFLWVHFLDPHKWYLLHDGFEKRWGTGNMDRYDHEIAFTDFHVGRVLDALAKSPVADKTAVIFTSDHGEAFGEHGTVFHGFSVYEDQLRVPLVIKVPGLTDGGQRMRKRVGGIDVAPTIADLLGVKITDKLQGRSLGPELMGKDTPQRLIYAERVRGPYSAGFRALIDGDTKLVWRAAGNRYELYDLEKDPGELDDLMSKQTELAAKMTSAMASMLEYGLDYKDKVHAGTGD